MGSMDFTPVQHAADAVYVAVATPAQVRVGVGPLGGYEHVLGAEATRADSLKVAADVEAYLASRALLRLLVAQLRDGSTAKAGLVGLTRHCLDCGNGDHGQPRAAGWALSSSRTRQLVLAAAAPAGVLMGADIEREPQAGAAGVFEGFDTLVLSNAERIIVAGCKEPDRLRIAAFGAKEALLKATGEGLRREPASLPVLGPHSAAALDTGAWQRVQLPAGGPQLQLCWIPAPSGHVASLAASRPLPVRRLAPRQLGLPAGS